MTDHNSKNKEQYANNKIFTLNNMLNLQDEGVAFNNSNMSIPQSIEIFLISYKDNLPMEPNIWDGKAHPIFIFRTMEF